jgi:hypothetical protein
LNFAGAIRIPTAGRPSVSSSTSENTLNIYSPHRFLPEYATPKYTQAKSLSTIVSDALATFCERRESGRVNQALQLVLICPLSEEDILRMSFDVFLHAMVASYDVSSHELSPIIGKVYGCAKSLQKFMSGEATTGDITPTDGTTTFTNGDDVLANGETTSDTSNPSPLAIEKEPEAKSMSEHVALMRKAMLGADFKPLTWAISEDKLPKLLPNQLDFLPRVKFAQNGVAATANAHLDFSIPEWNMWDLNGEDKLRILI